MNSRKEIGGYFELEIKEGHFLHDTLVQLNSGRNAFEYVLRLLKPSKVYFPKFTCDVMLEPLTKLGIAYDFYSINEKLEIADKPELKDGELILYTNYFGMKDEYSRELSRYYKDAFVLDCSQAYYFEPLEVGYTFYSPRKFFGVSDGGLLNTPQQLKEEFERDFSFGRISHLVKRLELGAEAGYSDFKTNDESLENQSIRQMSIFTQRILGTIDFDEVRRRRQENAQYLDEKLGSLNQLQVDSNTASSLMVYPLLIEKPDLRAHLIAHKIFVAQYWPNVLEWCTEDEVEYFLTKNIVPLPIDQRYTTEDMAHIVELLQEGIA